MRALPAITYRSEFGALIVRTDYSDEQAWEGVAEELSMTWLDSELESNMQYVDDSVWAEATVDEVLAAISVSDNDELSVIFIADRTTMQAHHHALLAVTTCTREDFDDDEYYEALIRHGRQFRTAPDGIEDIHMNLQVGNMDFDEFAGFAQNDPEGVYGHLRQAR